MLNNFTQSATEETNTNHAPKFSQLHKHSQAASLSLHRMGACLHLCEKGCEWKWGAFLSSWGILSQWFNDTKREEKTRKTDNGTWQDEQVSTPLLHQSCFSWEDRQRYNTKQVCVGIKSLFHTHANNTPAPIPMLTTYIHTHAQVCTVVHICTRTTAVWVNSSSTLLLAITAEGHTSAEGLSSRKKKPGSYVTSAQSWQGPRNRAARRQGKLGHSLNDCHSPITAPHAH